MKHLLIGALAAMASASGAPLIFSGFDSGLGEETPLAAFPNSVAAENEFKALLQGVETETFEGFSKGKAAPLPLTFPGVTATLTGVGFINSVAAGTTNGVGRYAISGTNFWDTNSQSFDIKFSAPVAAFGFYGVDVGDFKGDLIVKVGGVDYNSKTANQLGGSVMFWGIIDVENPFTEISFSNTNFGADFFAFDNMTIGSPRQVIPEPSTFALMTAGVALVAFARRFCR